MSKDHRDEICKEWLDNPAKFFDYLENEMEPCPPGHYVMSRIKLDEEFKPGNICWLSRRKAALHWHGVTP